MPQPQVHVRVGDTAVYIDFGDGSCVVPNKAERVVARKALLDALALLDSPAMNEIAQEDGEVGAKYKPKDRPRLTLVG